MSIDQITKLLEKLPDWQRMLIALEVARVLADMEDALQEDQPTEDEHQPDVLS